MTDILFKGSKGGGNSFTQTPDNLRSNDTFEAVLGVCIGPVKGPVRGLKSILLDGTAIENETGELNFKDFTAVLGNGDPAQFPQLVQLKLGAGGSPSNYNLQLTNPNASGPGGWITKTLANTNADFIDFRFVVQQLMRQDKTGIFTTTATIEIQLKPVGKTTWINPTITAATGTYNETGYMVNDVGGTLVRIMFPERNFDDNTGAWNAPVGNFPITGKTTSPEVHELRLAIPNTGSYANTGWDMRCRLLEKDSVDADPVFEKRNIVWESASAVYGSTLGDHEDWRGVAWLQLYGKASEQLTGVPEVTGIWDTKIMNVPPGTVFNPDTRQYTTATWDGAWTKAYTNDPAWVVNDAISDSLSGLSLIASGSYLNKWDALEASKWFSTLVPDGNGGTHPRYSMNLTISEPQKAEEFIRYLAGACGALAWDQGDGQWRMKVDKPETPVDIFTLEDIEGEFIYSHTDVDTRFNDITGTFKSEEMAFRQDRVRLFDNTSIAKIGRKPTTVALVGCTNRQEALRRVKLRLRSAVNETRMVTFTTNRRGRNINQLDLILIADSDLGDQDKKTTGRMVALSADRKTITVRDPLRLEIGVNYTISYAAPNATYNPDPTTQPGVNSNYLKPTTVRTANITNTSAERGNVKIIKIDTALPADVDANLVIGLSATGLVTLPKTYRVTSVAVADDDPERMAIAGIEVDTGKWDAADNVTNDDSVFQDLRGAVPKPLPPTSGNFLDVVTIPLEQGNQTSVVANWTRPAGAFISGFRVRHRVNGGAWQLDADLLNQTTFELVNPTAGSYTFEVSTIDRRGDQSIALLDDIDVIQDILGASDFTYDDGTPIEDLQPAQPGSDVTAQNQHQLLSSSPTIDFAATSTGTLKAGEINRTVTFQRKVGTTDVSASTTWSLIASAGNTVSISSTGLLSFTSVSDGSVIVTGAYGGTTMSYTLQVTKTWDAPAAPGTGTGGTIAYTSNISSASSSSYTTAGSDELTVMCGSSGQIDLSADLNFSCYTTGNHSCHGKWQWRLAGGTYADVAAEMPASQSAYMPSTKMVDELDSGPGYISVTTNKSGLTSGSSYNFKFLWRSDTSAPLYADGYAQAAQH
jgi:predicted phage tail protein